jgi:hypothetical protein
LSVNILFPVFLIILIALEVIRNHLHPVASFSVNTFFPSSIQLMSFTSSKVACLDENLISHDEVCTISHHFSVKSIHLFSCSSSS